MDLCMIETLVMFGRKSTSRQISIKKKSKGRLYITVLTAGLRGNEQVEFTDFKEIRT